MFVLFIRDAANKIYHLPSPHSPENRSSTRVLPGYPLCLHTKRTQRLDRRFAVRASPSPLSSLSRARLATNMTSRCKRGRFWGVGQSVYGRDSSITRLRLVCFAVALKERLHHIQLGVHVVVYVCLCVCVYMCIE